jgi:nucleoside-diphosphate-sugar epimerase
VLFASSSAVYGEHDGAWVDEDTRCAPLSFNGSVLLEAEKWLGAQAETSVVLRLSGLYGPGRTRLIELVAGGAARTPTGVRQWTHRVHVDDAAAACLHLLELPQPAGRYLVTDDAPAGLDEVYAFIAQRLGLPPPPAGEAPSERAVGNKRLSNARLRRSGFEFRYPDFRCGYAELLPALPR